MSEQKFKLSDDHSIVWIKKGTEMTEAPALQHRHFDLIVQWAKNPTQPVWFWNVNEWQKAEYVVWHMEHYVIGEKPTEPPIKMVKYDGGSIQFPSPAKANLSAIKNIGRPLSTVQIVTIGRVTVLILNYWKTA